jgi:hypothetical protein
VRLVRLGRRRLLHGSTSNLLRAALWFLGFPFRRETSFFVDSSAIRLGLLLRLPFCREARFRLPLSFPFRRETSFFVDSSAIRLGLLLRLSFCREARFRLPLSFSFRRETSFFVDSSAIRLGLLLRLSFCREARFRLPLSFSFRRETSFFVDSSAIRLGLLLRLSFCREARFRLRNSPLLFDCALSFPLCRYASLLKAPRFRLPPSFPFRRDASFVRGTTAPRSHHQRRYTGETDAADAEERFRS